MNTSRSLINGALGFSAKSYAALSLLVSVFVHPVFAFDKSQYEQCYLNERGDVVDERGGTYNPMRNPWHFEENRDCLKVAFKAAGTDWNNVYCSGLFPDDPRFSQIIATCKQLSKPLKLDSPCELKDSSGGTIVTRCDEFYAVKGSGSTTYSKISRDEMLERMFANKEVITVLEETRAAEKDRLSNAAFDSEIKKQTKSSDKSKSVEKALRFVKLHFELNKTGPGWYPKGARVSPYLDRYIQDNNLYGSARESRLALMKSLGSEQLAIFDCSGCDFSGMDLRKSAIGFQIDFSFADLTGARFFRTWLDKFIAVDANLTKASFEKAKIGAIHLHNANISQTDFGKSRLPLIEIGYNAHIDRAVIVAETKGVSFSGSTIEELRLTIENRGSTSEQSRYIGDRNAVTVPYCVAAQNFDARNIFEGMQSTKVSGLSVSLMDMRNFDFSQISLNGLAFYSSVFGGSNFSGLTLAIKPSNSLEMACEDWKIFDVLEGADFTNAQLTTAHVNNDIVSGRFGSPKFCGTKVKLGQTFEQIDTNCN